MQGKIIKGIGGFYYVYVEGKGLYECKAKGIFRNQKLKPMVGDNVEIDVLDEDKKLGNMVDILQRNNVLIRPAVANVDQAMILFAIASPAPNLNLLDRFLIIMNRQQVKTIICFNKIDLVDEEELARLREIYEHCGCQVEFISTYSGEGVDRVQSLLEGKTTVLAGPSGVGKSSTINVIKKEDYMETGAISEKIQRGKHTTRHSEIIHLWDNTYVMDTPGFSTLYIDEIEKDELGAYFTEFSEYEPFCKFAGCSHIHEPQCMVKQALEDGKISTIRYESYKQLYEELGNKRRW